MFRFGGVERGRGEEEDEEVLDVMPMAAWGRYRLLRRNVFEDRVQGVAKETAMDEGDHWVV